MRLEGLKTGGRRRSFHLIKGEKRKWTVLNEEEEDDEEKEEENTSEHGKPPGKDINDGSQGGNSCSGGNSSRSEGSGFQAEGLVLAPEASTRGAGWGSSSHRAEAFCTGTSMTRREFRRGLGGLSAPDGMLDVKTSIVTSFISNSLATCSRAPSPLSSNSSEPSGPVFLTHP
ncbi:hypothetical protein I315_01850 [Cryptococcus gattii Ru294]|nr:hypothetical protein I315_01850 [Cryptococcus gattii Ru294]